MSSTRSVWRGGDQSEAESLTSCYRRSIEVAAQRGLRTLAFPAISTGIYGYPSDAATRVAVATVRETMHGHPDIEAATFCCFPPAILRSTKNC